MTVGKNNISWAAFFRDHEVVKKVNRSGDLIVTAKQINKYREARLMTKFDSFDVLPEIFKNNELSILPISRGKYIIGKFEAYHGLPTFDEMQERMDVRAAYGREDLQSLNFEVIKSEAVALNAAYHSKILEDFLEDGELALTVNGRLGSGSFSFNINDTKGSSRCVSVSKAQMEIDGGFEGSKTLSLIEAKNLLSETFLVRQIYYPLRYWNDKIEKQVRPIFQVYTNSTFYLFEYKFTDINHYNSLQLIKSQAYQFRDRSISMKEIFDLLDNIKPNEDKVTSFPQANSFGTVISLCEFIGANGSVYQIEVTRKYGFDKRQTSYYADAAIYLGLVEKGRDGDGVFYELSKNGKQIFKNNFSTRQIGLISAILSRPVFHDTLSKYRSEAAQPTEDFVVERMKAHPIARVDKKKTFYRRAQTVLAWINWIISVPDDV